MRFLCGRLAAVCVCVALVATVICTDEVVPVYNIQKASTASSAIPLVAEVGALFSSTALGCVAYADRGANGIAFQLISGYESVETAVSTVHPATALGTFPQSLAASVGDGSILYAAGVTSTDPNLILLHI
ncbi:hypothetical protein KIPB_003552 [Kipferlia bialata]|uniref:Membrane-associated protein n=1 Tax=Kipferlia bialata TaxID=797122 RepID=A0A391NK24_9EUKA|nr:hypothetical protein KIPB_003552 [Kipferlia bialata]|eukprot:g3552.t1